PRLSAKQATAPVLLTGPCYPPPRASGHHHEPLGPGCCDCVDYESLATLSSQLRCYVAQPQLVSRRSRTRRVVAVWEIAVDERDQPRQGGKDDTQIQPSYYSGGA
ncbi:unnamed protein product, partial [Laminaria digitata]